MGIEAEDRKGEFGHIGFGKDDAPASTEPAHHWRVGHGGRCIGQHLGAGASWLASNIEQVLDAYDRAVKRAEGDAGTHPRVGGIRCLPSGFGVDGETGACTFALRVSNAS
jgi:hypothetical protein